MKKGLFIILLVISNIFFALLYLDALNKKPSSEKTAATKSSDASAEYPFLSKRIFAENQNDIIINFIPLRTALREYTVKQNNQVGVYFEYLPSGSSIGASDNLEVALASLIKTPLVMAVYRQIEQGKLKKDDVLTIKKDHLDPKFGDLWKKGEGTKITIQEAIDYALIKSDNTAANVLASVLPGTAIDNVFDSLDIPTDKEGGVTVISPKSYSSIFRSLYLSSYLKQESSNEVLEILTRTDFNDKIIAGLPGNIEVSHKIGVFNSATNKKKGYSDCGIVYLPQRPYLLCIMTTTNDQETQKYMQHISKMVYGYMVAVKGGN
jgi:beta-lactamase class A